MLPIVSKFVQAKVGMPEGFQLEAKFKPEARPIFYRPRLVTLAILEDLNDVYVGRIRKGVWKATDFNAYGTPSFWCKRQSIQDRTKPESGYAAITQ